VSVQLDFSGKHGPKIANRAAPFLAVFSRGASAYECLCTSMSQWFVRKSVGKAVKWKFAIRHAKNLRRRSCFSKSFIKCSFHPRPRVRPNHISLGSRFKNRDHDAIATASHHSTKTVADFRGQSRTCYQHSSVSVTSLVQRATFTFNYILLITSNLAFLPSGRRDSNPRPLEPHSSALPSCATARFF
jgi:hypothetical protein